MRLACVFPLIFLQCSTHPDWSCIPALHFAIISYSCLCQHSFVCSHSLTTPIYSQTRWSCLQFIRGCQSFTLSYMLHTIIYPNVFYLPPSSANDVKISRKVSCVYEIKKHKRDTYRLMERAKNRQMKYEIVHFNRIFFFLSIQMKQHSRYIQQIIKDYKMLSFIAWGIQYKTREDMPHFIAHV